MVAYVTTTLTNVGGVNTWSVGEETNSPAIGQPTASTGNVSITLQTLLNSWFAVNDPASLVHPTLGTISGFVDTVSMTGISTSLTHTTQLSGLTATRTLVPFVGSMSDYIGFLLGLGAKASWIGSWDSGGAGASVIAVSPVDGSVFVYSGSGFGPSFNKLVKLSASGQVLTSFAPNGTANGQVQNVGAMYVAANGNLYVADTGGTAHRVQIFDTDGNYINKWTLSATPYLNVSSMVIDSSSNVYVAGNNGSTSYIIGKFNSVGTSLTSVSGASVQGFMAIDSTNTIWVTGNNPATALAAQFDKYNTSLTLLGSVGYRQPSGFAPAIQTLAFDGNNYLYGATNLSIVSTTPAVYRFSAGVLVDSFGTYGSGPGQFSGFPHIAINKASNIIYIGDAGNFRVQWFVTYAPQPVSFPMSYLCAANPNVIMPAWTDSVWTKLNELCQAYAMELSIVNDVITIRDIGSRTIVLNNFEAPGPEIQVSSQNTVQSININYRNLSLVSSGSIYSALDDDNRIIQAEDGETVTVEVPVHGYPLVVSQPVQTATFPVDVGQFYVIASDDLPVVPAQFTAYGGSVTITIASINTLNVTLKAPTNIPGVVGPFRLAASDGTNTYGQLNISGSAVLESVQVLNLPTSADPKKTTQEEGQTIDNVFISTLHQAYDRGVWAADIAGGPTVSFTATLPLNSITGFGLTPGMIFTYGNSKYRILSSTVDQRSVRITAVRHVLAGDVVTLWTGQTAGANATFWGGAPSENATIQPLKIT